jgi:hypothetical protein
MGVTKERIAKLLFEEEERWEVIPTYPNYEASNLGNVRRLKNGRQLKLQQDERGYITVMLYTNKKKYNKRVHRLVWSAFNGEECELFIDHKNKDITDNHIDNLRCVTPSENSSNRIDFTRDNKYNLNDYIKRDI